MASTAAAALPARISLARLGPVSTPAGWPGSSSAITSVIRLLVPRSSPLASDTTGTRSRRWGRSDRRVARNPCDGTPITTTSAAAAASAASAVALSSGWSR